MEALRLASIQNEVGLEQNLGGGPDLVEFSQEILDRSFDVALMRHVIPGWVRRLGGADAPIVDVFNGEVGSLVGI